jgi:hypothetical protein
MDAQRDEVAGALGHAEAMLGGLSRRRFFRVAGFSVAGTAVLAACGADSGTSTNVPQAGPNPVTTALPTRVVSDVTLLRTASSLEHSLIDTYNTLTPLVSDQALKDTINLFVVHHQAHAVSFEAATRQLGGVPFTDANPVFDASVVQPTLKLITDGGGQSADVIAFAYALESVASATYQSFVPIYTTPNLRSSVMAVGGAEARQAAIFAGLIQGASPVAPLVNGASTAPTTTTVAGTTTTLKGGNPPPVYQVPGIFQPLTPVEVGINRTTISVDLLGPNSYIYEPASG